MCIRDSGGAAGRGAARRRLCGGHAGGKGLRGISPQGVRDMPSSIYDIARAAGCSISTVSKAVSYTPLDVYKRQGIAGARGRQAFARAAQYAAGGERRGAGGRSARGGPRGAACATGRLPYAHGNADGEDQPCKQRYRGGRAHAHGDDRPARLPARAHFCLSETH